MPKLPWDLSGKKLAKKLQRYGYAITRQTGSHIRLTSKIKNEPHIITIPDHHELKIGTLNNILKDVAGYLQITKEQLIKEMF